jgi:hypothetical protein
MMARMAAPPAEPRFPHLDPQAPHYESYFIKAVHPSEPRAFWMRHTVHQRPGEPRTASIWLTLFDANAAHPVIAGKHTVGADRLSSPDGGYIRIEDSTVEPGRAVGTLQSQTLTTDWDFAIETGGEELRHLPIARMYEAKVPRTKSVTPHPAAQFSGQLGDWDLDGWTGVSSHNWGSEHAERWVWLHCGRFDGRGRDTWIEMAIGRIKLGPFTVPWIANGAVSVDGRRYRLGGPQRIRQTKIEETPLHLRFLVGGEGVKVEGEITAPPEHMVVWRYADPEGPEHHSAHTSIGDMTLRVTERGKDAPPVELHGRQSATYELGMRETDHGLPVQPYDDGRL